MARISADRSEGQDVFLSPGKVSGCARDNLSVAVPTPSSALETFEYGTATGALTTIFDPATTTCSSAATCGTSAPVRSPFPNNIIPANRLDPAAKILSTYWGQPNTPGLPFTNLKNYSNNASVGGGNDEYNLRIDHNLGEAHRLFFRATYFTDRNLPIEPYSNPLCQDRCLKRGVA
jgi:hypothetical protein